MGAWASLAVQPKRVYDAHRSVPFVEREVDGETVTFSFAAGIDPAAPEAKQLASDALLERLGRYSARFGSPELFLDTIAADGRLAGSVQSLLSYALLHSEQFSGRNTRRDVYADDADYFLKRMREAARAIAETAPAVLGLTGRSGPASGGAVASIYT